MSPESKIRKANGDGNGDKAKHESAQGHGIDARERKIGKAVS